MKFTGSVVAGLGLLVGLASAAATGADLTARQETVSIEFQGPAFLGGENVTLHGSPEEIYNQLVELNPNYDNDFREIDAGEDGNAPQSAASNGEFNRGDQDLYPILECDTFRRAHYKRIKQGINYLRKLKGECYLPPRSCGRISCSWESAVFWCSNLDITQSEPCKFLGEHVNFLNEICPCHEDGGKGSCYLSGIYDVTYYKGMGDLDNPVATIQVKWDDC